MIPASTNALIFDMDGVLWHSNKIHEEAYRQTLDAENLSMPDYHRFLSGRRTDEVMADLLISHKCDASHDRVLALTKTKQRHARTLLASNPPLASRCVEVLDYLSKSYRLALASSASTGSVEIFLQAVGTQWFDVVLHGGSVQKAKPDPEIYFEALKRLHLSADNALVVEDATSGVRSARGAGIEVIGMVGTQDGLALREAGAFWTIDHLHELIS